VTVGMIEVKNERVINIGTWDEQVEKKEVVPVKRNSAVVRLLEYVKPEEEVIEEKNQYYEEILQ